jgi:hypothetical protein
MKKVNYNELTSLARHAEWRLKGIRKYLSARLNSSTQAVWNEFVRRSKQVKTVTDITQFEQELERQFLAEPVLRRAYWKRVFEEDRLYWKIGAQLKNLRSSIDQLEKRLVGFGSKGES